MRAKVVTIFSNKGGVGKTFVSVNLAASLALAGKKVLVLDMDLQAGQDMARMLNLSPHTSVADVFTKLEKNADSSLVLDAATVHSSGLAFMPAVRHAKQVGHITPDTLKPFLERAAEAFDYIFIDGGMSFSETLITALDHSNLILLVATPDILAVYQIKWCLEVLHSLQFPARMVKLILNRSESRGSVAWQEVRSAVPCEIFGHIPSEGRTVGTALNRGVPCIIDSPRSKVAEAFKKMTEILQNDETFAAATNIERRATTGEGPSQEFWEKFGITKGVVQASEAELVAGEEDEILEVKRKIHEKLVERLNLDGFSPETLTDPEALASVKETAEEVVASLLMEEGAGKIATHEERQVLARDIVNEALGLGPLEEFLADPDVTDIMVNGRNKLYVEKNGKLILTNKKFISDDKIRAVIDRIIAPLGRRIDESTPMVDARLPDGSRINAIIPPLTLGGPMITIRKFGQERITVDDLLNKHKSFNKPIMDFLQACVVGRRNIIVSGGTGAGKTTLLNVLSEFVPDNERIITIEDAAELQLKKSHWARLESRPSNVEGKGQVSIRDLFINSLRMRPDRIVIGECRGPEVLDMLQAMNTGHDGSLTTLHANSTKDVLTRMHSMILLSGMDLPTRAVNEMIASAIDLIVSINRFGDGSRKITGISEIVGLTEDWYLDMKDVFVFKQTGVDGDGTILGEFKATGYVPMCYEELVTRGIKVDKAIFNP